MCGMKTATVQPLPFENAMIASLAVTENRIIS